MRYSVIAVLLGLSTLAGQSPGQVVPFRGVDYLASGPAVVYGTDLFPVNSMRWLWETIHIRSLVSGEDHTLWSRPDKEVMRLEQLSLCPTGQLIAFRELVPDPENHGVGRNWLLHIIDHDGTEIRQIPAACTYSWSPDGSHLAYIEGWYIDNGARLFPKDTWVLNLKTGEQTKLRGPYYDLRWAAFDSRLYLYHPYWVHRWSRDEADLVLTSYEGILFSSGGTYRLSYDKWSPFDVFSRDSGESVLKEGAPEELKAAANGLRGPEWLGDETFLADAAGSSQDDVDYVVNVRTGECRTSSRKIVAVVKPDIRVVTFDGDKDVFAEEDIAGFSRTSLKSPSGSNGATSDLSK